MSEASRHGEEPDRRAEMRPGNLNAGMALGPLFYVVSAEQVRGFAAALGSDCALYRDDAPGGAAAPPTMRLNDYSLLIAKHFKGGSGGVHAKQRCEFHQPMQVGQAVRVEGKILRTWRARGKFYFELEYEQRDAASGELLIRQAITSVLLAGGEMK